MREYAYAKCKAKIVLCFLKITSSHDIGTRACELEHHLVSTAHAFLAGRSSSVAVVVVIMHHQLHGHQQQHQQKQQQQHRHHQHANNNHAVGVVDQNHRYQQRHRHAYRIAPLRPIRFLSVRMCSFTLSDSQVKNECVQVVVRCRPMSKKEMAGGDYKPVVDVYPSRGVIEIHNPAETAMSANRDSAKMFTYDAVYDKR